MNKNKNLAYGYVYDSDGMYDEIFVFENTPINVASFITINNMNECTITNEADTLILTSITGGFVDTCPDQDYLTRVLFPVLLPMQTGQADPIKIEFIQDHFTYEMEM